MKALTALRLTLDKLGTRNTELELATGKAKQQISRIRNQSNGISTDTLDEILSALPIEGKVYFGWLLTQSEPESTIEPVGLLDGQKNKSQAIANLIQQQIATDEASTEIRVE